MSLKGWLDTLDKFAPRCPQCSRKMRNRVKCPVCGQVSCSHNCHERHVKSAHPILVEQNKQAKKDLEQANRHLADLQRQEQKRKATLDAILAEQKIRKQLEKQETDAVIAREKKITQLRREINQAADLLEDRLDAWRQAGSPDIRQADLDRAKEEACRRRAVLREANMERSINSLQMDYLQLANFVRKMSSQLGMAWIATAIIGGAVAFTFAVLVGLLFTKSLVLTFALGGFGFLSGFLAFLCVLLFPNDKNLQQGLTTLGQQKSDQLKPQEAAKLAYEKAQQEYDYLASLDQLRTDCDVAARKKQQLREEYQAICDE